MYVEGNGIPIDTIVTGITVSGSNLTLTLAHYNPIVVNIPPYESHPNTSISHALNIDVSSGTKVTFTTGRNNFYNNLNHYSMIKVLFNGDKGTVKRFKTLDYEGSQAETIENLINDYLIYNPGDTIGTSIGEIYYDNHEKTGWYVKYIETDMQEGKVNEFMNKENKWFNNIIGLENIDIEDTLDTGEFSLQGLGFSQPTI
jgi:hypothetical protein